MNHVSAYGRKFVSAEQVVRGAVRNHGGHTLRDQALPSQTRSDCALTGALP